MNCVGPQGPVALVHQLAGVPMAILAILAIFHPLNQNARCV